MCQRSAAAVQHRLLRVGLVGSRHPQRPALERPGGCGIVHLRHGCLCVRCVVKLHKGKAARHLGLPITHHLMIMTHNRHTHHVIKEQQAAAAGRRMQAQERKKAGGTDEAGQQQESQLITFIHRVMLHVQVESTHKSRRLPICLHPYNTPSTTTTTSTASTHPASQCYTWASINHPPVYSQLGQTQQTAGPAPARPLLARGCPRTASG